MSYFNKVMLMGRVVGEPELKYLPSGTAVCNFSMAMNRTWMKDGEKVEEVCFAEIAVFGKQAESTNKYVSKGDPLFVEGRLNQNNWEDRETGAKRSKLTVVAERVQFLKQKSNDGQQDQNQQQVPQHGTYNPDGQSADYNQAPHPQAHADHNAAVNQQPPPQVPPQQPTQPQLPQSQVNDESSVPF